MPTPNELYDQAVDLKEGASREGRHRQARRRRTTHDNGFAIAHGMLAKLYADIAETDKAIAHAKKVVELAPDDTFCYTALSVIYQRCCKIPVAELAKAMAFNKQMGPRLRAALPGRGP